MKRTVTGFAHHTCLQVLPFTLCATDAKVLLPQILIRIILSPVPTATNQLNGIKVETLEKQKVPGRANNKVDELINHLESSKYQ